MTGNIPPLHLLQHVHPSQIIMSSYDIRVIPGAPICLLGEGPHWVASKQELIYVDILGSTAHRYVPSTGQHFKVDLGGNGAIIVPVEGSSSKYIVSVGHEICVMEWDGLSPQPRGMKTLYSVDEAPPSTKINDGKCDALGRLWGGTMAEGDLALTEHNSSGLYSFGLDGKVVKRVDNISLGNGLAWSADNKSMYHIDSMTYTVNGYDFDLSTGAMTNRRVIYDMKANGEAGIPDGMTIDGEGKLWLANAFGKKVIKIDPNTGKKLAQIDFPVEIPTSVAFGGPNLDILYVTTCSGLVTPEKLKEMPTSGQLYEVRNTGSRGQSAGRNYKGPV